MHLWPLQLSRARCRQGTAWHSNSSGTEYRAERGRDGAQWQRDPGYSRTACSHRADSLCCRSSPYRLKHVAMSSQNVQQSEAVLERNSADLQSMWRKGILWRDGQSRVADHLVQCPVIYHADHSIICEQGQEDKVWFRLREDYSLIWLIRSPVCNHFPSG